MGFLGEPCESCDRPRPDSFEEYYAEIQKRFYHESVYGSAYWCKECGITFDPKSVTMQATEDDPVSVSIEGERAVGVEDIEIKTVDAGKSKTFGRSALAGYSPSDMAQEFSGSFSFTLEADNPEAAETAELLEKMFF